MSGIQVFKSIVLSILAAVAIPSILSQVPSVEIGLDAVVVGVTFAIVLCATLIASLDHGRGGSAANRTGGQRVDAEGGEGGAPESGEPFSTAMEVERSAGGDDDEGDDREEGVVKWFSTNKGFGFITRASGDDVFVHYRSIRGCGHRSLNEGQRVRFNVHHSEKGLQADDVSIVRS